jgi:hypothetical protein
MIVLVLIEVYNLYVKLLLTVSLEGSTVIWRTRSVRGLRANVSTISAIVCALTAYAIHNSGCLYLEFSGLWTERTLQNTYSMTFLSASSNVYLNGCKWGGECSSALAPWPSLIFCASPLNLPETLCLQWSTISYLARSYSNRMISGNISPGNKIIYHPKPHSHRTCEAVSVSL